jgi:two-component system, OmpR family, response regulator
MLAKILIAEDEPFIIESLTFLLDREGYQVSAVADGTAVIGRVQQEAPDLLILDIMLPEMSGFEILRRLRAAPATERLPVLVLSAKGQEADRRRMDEFGADDYLTKPFSNKELLERIASLLQRVTPAEGAGNP